MLRFLCIGLLKALQPHNINALLDWMSECCQMTSSGFPNSLRFCGLGLVVVVVVVVVVMSFRFKCSS